ncbi:MAG: metalloprotease PmbA [Thiotrichaceae bacterium]|nr:metalloprotease PmbA [Thiotrichaceae bacterium]
MKLSQQSLLDLADQVLATAKKQGATSASVGVNYGNGLSVDVRKGAVETLEYNRDQGLGLTVYFGQKKGHASTADLTEQAIKDTVDAACRIARYTAEDEFSGLADAELMATEFADLDLYHPWDINAEQAIELAIECEAAGLAYSNKIDNSEGSGVTTYKGVSVAANSHGFVGVSRGSQHGLSASFIAKENDAMQRDHWYSSHRVADKLEAAATIGEKAAKRAVERLNPRKIETTKSPILLSPNIAKTLISSYISAVSGSALYHKATFLLDSLGTPVFPEFMRIHETPFLLQGSGSASFDGEGVTLKNKDLVTEGIVQTYLLGSYSARKLGLKSTANAGGTFNLNVESTGENFTELLAKMGTGLFVTELIGSSVSIMTGDYSRGASGFWVENGEIQFPVEEVTIAGNLKRLFKGIVAIGNDIDTRGNTRMGSMLIDEMTIAGK